jgi:hypothetical protein
MTARLIPGHGEWARLMAERGGKLIFRKTVQVFPYKAVLHVFVRENDAVRQFIPNCRISVVAQETGQVLAMCNTSTGSAVIMRFEKPCVAILGVYCVGYVDHIQRVEIDWDSSAEVLLDRSYLAGMSDAARQNIERQRNMTTIEHNGGIFETWDGERWYRSDSAGNEIIASVGVYSNPVSSAGEYAISGTPAEIIAEPGQYESGRFEGSSVHYDAYDAWRREDE